MEQVLVTGCCGFIGSKVCEFLLQRGYKVVGIDNLNNYYNVLLKYYRLKTLSNFENFVFEKLNIENLEALQQLFKRFEFEAVYNLAAMAGVHSSLKNPQLYISTNVTGTVNLLECMRAFKIEKLVQASTSSLYAGEETPFNEKLPVNKPLSPYAASKKGAEMFCYSYHHLYNIDVSIVRYFTVYGPAGRPDMSVFRFIHSIDQGKQIEVFGDGEQSRDFTYVDDIARGTIQASKKVGYEVFNLGGGKKPTSLNSVVNFISKERGVEVPSRVIQEFHKADIVSTQADITKAERLLGYRSAVSIDQGLLNTLKWHKDNNHWLKSII